MIKAISAAENEYGNSPDGTSVKVLTKGTKYRVTVGLHNEEDGPHDYYVVFPSGCSSSPKVSEVPSLPHPLRVRTVVHQQDSKRSFLVFHLHGFGSGRRAMIVVP